MIPIQTHLSDQVPSSSGTTPNFPSGPEKHDDGPLLSKLNKVFEHVIVPTLPVAKEYRARGYNAAMPEVDFSQRTLLQQHVDQLDKVLCDHGDKFEPHAQREMEILSRRLRKQIECLTENQVTEWVKRQVPKVHQTTVPPMAGILGIQGVSESSEHMGSRKTAQALVRRLDASLAAMVAVACGLTNVVLHRDLECIKQRVERHLLESLTYRTQCAGPLIPEGKGRQDTLMPGTVDQPEAQELMGLKETLDWHQLHKARVQAELEEQLAQLKCTCQTIDDEIKKLSPLLGRQTETVRHEGAAAYLNVTYTLLKEATCCLKSGMETLQQQLEKLQDIQRSRGEIHATWSPPLTKSTVHPSITEWFTQKVALSKQETSSIKSKANIIAQKALTLGQSGLQAIDEFHQPKTDTQLLSDSIVRSILWRLQQHPVALIQVAIPLMYCLSELDKMKGGKSIEPAGVPTLPSNASPTDRLQHMLLLESPEMKHRTKLMTLSTLLNARLDEVERVCDTVKLNGTISALKSQAEAFYELTDDEAISLGKTDRHQLVDRCDRVCFKGHNAEIRVLAEDLRQSTDLLRQAITAGKRRTRNLSEVKRLVEQAVTKAVFAKGRLSKLSVSETGRDLNALSRGAHLAKYWAMMLSEHINAQDGVPSIRQILTLIHQHDLQEQTLSKGDPKGILLATRVTIELNKAQIGELQLSMTPQQYADHEKDMLEFMVSWGQRRFTRGLLQHPIGAFELAFSISSLMTFNILSPLYRLPVASLQIPYKIHKTKEFIAPGHDKPYKAIETVIKKRLTQLGLHMVTSPLPSPIKTGLGFAIASAGYVYNNKMDEKDRTVDATFERLIEGKSSQKIRMETIKTLTLQSITALPHSGIEAASRTILSSGIPKTRQEDRLVMELKSRADQDFDHLVETVDEDSSSSSHHTKRTRRSIDSIEGRRLSVNSLEKSYFERFGGDIQQFSEKMYNQLERINQPEAFMDYLDKQVGKMQRMINRAERPAHQEFFQSALELLEAAKDAGNKFQSLKVFQPPLSQIDELLFETMSFKVGLKYAEIQPLIEFQKSLWSLYLVLSEKDFEAHLARYLEQCQQFTHGLDIQDPNLTDTERSNFNTEMVINSFRFADDRDSMFKEYIETLVENIKANASREELSSSIREVQYRKQSSDHPLDKIVYTFCEQLLLNEFIELTDYRTRVANVTEYIFKDPRFEYLRVSLLPSELMYIQDNLSLSSQKIVDELLLYRMGEKLSLHDDIENAEARYLSAIKDHRLPNGSSYTRQQQIEEINHQGGLITYERATLRTNRILQARRDIELQNLSRQFWQEQGIDHPDKVSYIYRYPSLPAAALYTMPDENSPRSEQIQRLEHIKRFEPSYNRVIESKMGPKYLHSVNRTELSQDEINWDVDKYHEHLKLRLTHLWAAQPDDKKEYLNNVLPSALTPPKYTESVAKAPYFIKPSINDWPLENMLLLKDGLTYTVISLLPPSGKIEVFEGRDDLISFFVAPGNHEWVLSHASLYHQMDGRERYGIESALESIRAGTPASDWKFIPETSNFRMVEPGVLRTIAQTSMGNQGTGHYVRTSLVEATSRSYWQGISGNHSIEVSGEYSLPEKWKSANGQASFDKLYALQKTIDMQRLAETAISQFKNKHFEAYSDHLKDNFYRLINTARHRYDRLPWKNELLEKICFEPDKVEASIPGLLGKSGEHLPLEGMIMFHDSSPDKAKYVMVSLLGEGALVEFDTIEDVHHFFANPGNRYFLLSHISEHNKQPEPLGVSTPADTLDVMEEQATQYPRKVGISPFWSSTRSTFSVHKGKIPVSPLDPIGSAIRIAAGAATDVTTDALNISCVSLTRDWHVSMFDTLATRNLQRLESDADTLFKSHDEWRTEKALEITSAVLAIPAIALSMSAIAASGGAAAAPLAAAALTIDGLSFATTMAEGIYMLTQADSSEERIMGLVPIALAPLDLLGAAASTSDFMKAINVMKRAKVMKVAGSVSDAAFTGTRNNDAIGLLNVFSRESGVDSKSVFEEPLNRITNSLDENFLLKRDLSELVESYPKGTLPSADLEDFSLDENHQVAVQRLGSPKLAKGKWGGIIQDDSEVIPAVRSSRGEYMFSDTPTGAKSIGLSANNRITLMRYLEAYPDRQVVSDIEEMPSIYVRIGSRPGAARIKGLFPLEDAVKSLLNGLNNLAIRTGGIPGPTSSAIPTPGSVAKPLSSVTARYRKIVGWEKSLSAEAGHGVMLEISPYPGAGMIKVGEGKVSFRDIAAAAFREPTSNQMPQVASQSTEIGLEGRSINWNQMSLRAPLINGSAWQGLPGVLPGSDLDFYLYKALGGQPDVYFSILKEAEPNIPAKGFKFDNQRLLGKVEEGQFRVSVDKGLRWETGSWQQEWQWRFRYRKGVVDSTEELDKRLMRAKELRTTGGEISAFEDAKYAGELDQKVVTWLAKGNSPLDITRRDQLFNLVGKEPKALLESGELRQSGFLVLMDQNSLPTGQTLYVHVSPEGAHLYLSENPTLQDAMGKGVSLRKPAPQSSVLRTKYRLDEQGMTNFNKYIQSQNQAVVFTSVDEVHRNYIGVRMHIERQNEEMVVKIDGHTEHMQILSPRTVVGRLPLNDSSAQSLSDPLVQYTDQFKGQRGVQAISVHADAKGGFYYKDEGEVATAHSASELMAYLKEHGVDLRQGHGPIHLLSCYAKNEKSGAAKALANVTQRPVVAYSNRKLRMNSPQLIGNKELKLETQTGRLRRLLSREDFKPASEKVFYPKTSGDALTEKNNTLPLRTNDWHQTMTLQPHNIADKYAVEQTSQFTKPVFDKYANEPLENCENASRELSDILKVNPDYSNVRLGNLAFWDSAYGREADVYTNHWVVMAKFKGVELVLDPTAHQFSNKLGIEKPILDTYSNWVARYQKGLNQKRMTLAKIVEVKSFTQGPFASNNEFSGFRFIPNAKVLSVSRWYHQSGYDQYIQSLRSNVRAQFFINEPSTSFSIGREQGLNTEMSPKQYFSKFKQGKVQDGIFFVSMDLGNTWRRGNWREEFAFRIGGRLQTLNDHQVDAAINEASRRDPSYSRICYTGAFNDAEQAGGISPELAYQLHHKIAKKDARNEIINSEVYGKTFGLFGRGNAPLNRYDPDVFSEPGFIHLGEEVDYQALPWGKIVYDHVVYVHVHNNQVFFYQVNGSDFQDALGPFEQIGSNVSKNHSKHLMDKERISSFNNYFEANPRAVYHFTPTKNVAKATNQHAAVKGLLQAWSLDIESLRNFSRIEGKVYLYFPELNAEHINTRLIPLLRFLHEEGEKPVEIVFRDSEQVRLFKQVLVDTYGPELSSELEPEHRYLYSVGRTKLHDLSEDDSVRVINEVDGASDNEVWEMVEKAMKEMRLPRYVVVDFTKKAI
ncbi:hypothetical protein [Vibrio coralliilyticus]|uniref:Tox-PLDMTX domain-containing protein n=1 Tax=Vibrio coralliilyticus TaxID=190893 RepID=A0AAP7DFB0_9VIBR|nr:hypothetical protein [Vibrio coralliilyticus]NOJ24250.1 hypothetical protein [Vibrio coralliilyticus]